MVIGFDTSACLNWAIIITRHLAHTDADTKRIASILDEIHGLLNLMESKKDETALFKLSIKCLVAHEPDMARMLEFINVVE